MEDFSMYVPNVHFEQIPIKNLVSSQEYQRMLSQAHILRVMENFDLYQVNPVKVSRRNGINYVFNGQHTIEIVAAVSRSRETPVWCMIYDDLSYEQEANIFANQQKYIKPLQAIEVFKGNIEAKNDDQLTIQSLVDSYGLVIANKKGPGVICAVSTLEKVYKNYGYHVLSRVLRIISGTWEGDANSFSANFLNAIAKLVVTFGDELNETTFKERVGNLSVKQISRIAADRRKGSMGVAEAMLIEYNGHKKNPHGKLSLGKLYTKDNSAFAVYDGLDNQEDDPFIDAVSDDEPLAALYM